MEFVGGVRTEEETKRWLQENLRHWTVHEFGIWAFHHVTEGAFVGRCGLRRVQLDTVDEVELGYSLMPGYWGKGLATEMAEAMLAIGFDHVRLRSIIAMIYASNDRSRRVAERLGFQFERLTAWKGSEAMLYRKRADQGAA